MEKLVAALVLILTWTLYRLWEHSKEHSLYALVAWSVGDLSPLRTCISITQNSLKLPSEYCVEWGEEGEFADEVLNEYQKNLVSSYFGGHLKSVQSKYVINGEDYFLFSLFYFLHRHQHDLEFGGRKMRDSSNISEFSVVYHKLLYIAALFCVNSKSIGSIREQKEMNSLIFLSAQSVKTTLDTGEVQT